MRFIFALLMAAALTISCGGGGTPATPAAPPEVPPAPTALTLAPGPGIDQVTLQWTPVPSVLGYLLEAKAGEGPFEPLNNAANLIPAAQNQVLVTFAPNAPELTEFQFRLKSYKRTTPSGPSNEVSFFRTLNRPSAPSPYSDPVADTITLNWYSNSSLATGTLIERVRCDINGAPLESWVSLPLLHGIQSEYVDSDLQEGTRYAYRATNTAGAVQGPASVESIRVITAPLFRLESFACTPASGGFILRWVNRSTTADRISIYRYPGPGGGSDPLAQLPGDATSFEDPDLPAGYYSYQAEISSAQGNLRTDILQVFKAPVGSPLALSSTIRELPAFNQAVLRPQGSWAFLSTFPYPTRVFSFGDPWAEIEPEAVHSDFLPTLGIDVLGAPHLSYARQESSADPGGRPCHLWFNGVGWTSEVLSSTQVTRWDRSAAMPAVFGPTGLPSMLLNIPSPERPGGGGMQDLAFLTFCNDHWQEDSLAGLTPDIPFITSFHMGMDQSGGTHLLFGSSSSLIAYHQPIVGGVWTSETVPLGLPALQYGAFIAALWESESNGWVLFERPFSSDLQDGRNLYVIRKQEGTWALPVLLISRKIAYEPIRLARSADGSRVAVAAHSEFGLKIFDLRAEGWQETVVAPSGVTAPFLGFDAGGKMHLLVRNSDSRCTEYKE